MNVEDSYEGAVRRLQRLGHVALVPPKPTRDEERERELEELATLACDENEKLKGELESAQDEIARLNRVISTLRETMAISQADDAYLPEKPARSSSGTFYAVVFLIACVGAAAVFALRPWEHGPGVFAAAVTMPTAGSTSTAISVPVLAPKATEAAKPAIAPTPAAAPAHSAATSAPTAAPVIPKAATPAPAVTIPKAAPVIPKAAPAIPKAQPEEAPAVSHHHRAAKHHEKAARSHTSEEHKRPSKGMRPESTKTDDPLGGLPL
jgi:hypothetical protein